MKPLWIVALVLMLGACGTSRPQDVPGLRQAVGNSLPGAQGLTLEDQEKIDDTVARGCKTGVYTGPECDLHTEASAGRRAL